VAGVSNAQDLVERAHAPAAKERLRAATNRAIARGVFGVPSVLVDDELFWGTDALLDLEAYLTGAAPAFSDAGFSELPAAAVRKTDKA
jgi:2-hydroxychromene-2-carboxylate isomerase